MVIENNNPNLVPYLIIGLCIMVIIVNVIGILCKSARKKRLEEIKREVFDK